MNCLHNMSFDLGLLQWVDLILFISWVQCSNYLVMPVIEWMYWVRFQNSHHSTSLFPIISKIYTWPALINNKVGKLRHYVDWFPVITTNAFQDKELFALIWRTAYSLNRERTIIIDGRWRNWCMHNEWWKMIATFWYKSCFQFSS